MWIQYAQKNLNFSASTENKKLFFFFHRIINPELEGTQDNH